MKQKQTFFITAVLLLIAAGGLFAGGQGASGGSGGLTTIQMTQISGYPAGIMEGTYWTEILKEDLGIQLDFVPSTPDNIRAMAAARDFPELVVTNQQNELDTAIRGGLFLDLEPHLDKLSNITRYPGMIQYMRDNYSGGTGKLYTIKGNVSNKGSTTGSNNLGPYLRWDWYKELGMPAITDWEDYLQVLKAMVDRHPTNEAGQKIYGISLWSNWDGNQSMSTAAIPMYMLNKFNPAGYLEVDMGTGAANSYLDDNSAYKRALKFYFTANQMGILDPDSITQTWDTFLEKGTAGRNLFSLQTYGFGSFNTAARAEQGIGYRLVSFKNEKIYNYSSPFYVGNQCFFAVSTKTRQLDKILEFINYCYSYDGWMNLQLGRKGVAWDVDSAGEPYLTETGWKMRNDSTVEFPNGGKMSSGYSWATNEPAINGNEIHPTLKRSLGGGDWIKKPFAPADTPLVVDWRQNMNAIDDMDYFIKNNMLATPSFFSMPPMPDEITAVYQRVGAVVQPGSWQAVYAKDEAEFNAIWTKMQSDAKGLGIDQVNQWALDAYRKAVADGSKYMY